MNRNRRRSPEKDVSQDRVADKNSDVYVHWVGERLRWPEELRCELLAEWEVYCESYRRNCVGKGICPDMLWPGKRGAVNPSFRILWTEAVTIYVKGIKLEWERLSEGCFYFFVKLFHSLMHLCTCKTVLIKYVIYLSLSSLTARWLSDIFITWRDKYIS